MIFFTFNSSDLIGSESQGLAFNSLGTYLICKFYKGETLIYYVVLSLWNQMKIYLWILKMNNNRQYTS